MPAYEYLTKDAPPAWDFCGTEGDVILKSSIFLARNFKDYRFPHLAGTDELAKVLSIVRGALIDFDEKFDEVYMNGLSDLDRDILIDKRYITESLCKDTKYRSAFIKNNGKTVVLANEEDHVLISSKREGLGFYEVLEDAFKIDDRLDEVDDYAFDENYGYLTALPSRTGTGLRATVLLHLPALAYTKNIKNTVDVANKFGLDLVPLCGTKEKEWQGNLFVLSNIKTIGLPEVDMITRVTNFAKEVAVSERRGREALLKYRKDMLDDVIYRAFGLLERAKLLTEKEALDAASKLQLGSNLGVIDKLPGTFFGEVYTISRASFLRSIAEDPDNIDHLRAIMLTKQMLNYKEK